MSDRDRALLLLIGALAVGAIAQGVAKREAALLGMSMLEVAVAGYVVGSVAQRAFDN